MSLNFTGLILKVSIIDAGQAVADVVRTQSGHYVPPELRRDHEMRILDARRKHLQDQAEVATGQSLLDIQGQVLELDQEELELQKEIERDTHKHHKIREQKRKSIKKLKSGEVTQEEHEALLRRLEREHSEIRLGHFGATREQMDQVHQLRDTLHDFRAELKTANNNNDKVEQERIQPLLEEAAADLHSYATGLMDGRLGRSEL